MNIGDFLKTKRKEQGLSVRQLAEIANCHYSTVQKYESGNIKNKGETFIKIVSALNLNNKEKEILSNLFNNNLILKKNKLKVNGVELDFSGLKKEDLFNIQKYINYIKFNNKVE